MEACECVRTELAGIMCPGWGFALRSFNAFTIQRFLLQFTHIQTQACVYAPYTGVKKMFKHCLMYIQSDTRKGWGSCVRNPRVHQAMCFKVGTNVCRNCASFKCSFIITSSFLHIIMCVCVCMKTHRVYRLYIHLNDSGA